MQRAILTQDPSLDRPAITAVNAACPYKGLEAYDVDDHDRFFGRDGHVAECLERLRSHRLLVVTGASGSGKSSLVRAGLVPALAYADDQAVVIVPGVDPIAEFDQAALAAGREGTLVIDQFEELFAVGLAAHVLACSVPRSSSASTPEGR